MAAKREDELSKVTLLNGAEVAPGRIISIMGVLNYLAENGATGQHLLRCAYDLSKGQEVGQISQTSIRRLKELDIVDDRGALPDDVKAIVLSAVEDDNRRSGILMLHAPYQSTPENDAGFESLLERIEGPLGIRAYGGHSKPQPDEPKRRTR